MIKLSVIVPVYNVESYLGRCIRSVINGGAEKGDYELILINDGSTDSSGEIAASYQAAEPELIRLVTTENLGQGHARDLGVDLAAGEYLLFLDSDDYLAEGALGEMLAIPEGDYDICIFDSIAVNGDGKQLKYMQGCKSKGELRLANCPELLLEGPDVWNKLIRRSLFTDKGIRFPSRVWFEDLRTIPKLYAFTDKVIYIAKPWHRYFQRPGSVTHMKSPERNLEIIDAVDELLDFYRELGMYEQLKDALEYLAFHSQLLTSSVRANQAQWNSPVQDRLIEDYIKKFPDFRENPYVKAMGRNHRLLTALLLRRRYMAVHLIMAANDTVKGKRSF